MEVSKMTQTNIEIINKFCEKKQHSKHTRTVYKTTLMKYSEFNQMSLCDLIKEAEAEEDKGIRWKRCNLLNRLESFRAYLVKNFSENTAKQDLSRVKTFYKSFRIEIGELDYLSDKVYNKRPTLEFEEIIDKDTIRRILELCTPVLKSLILFQTSSGSAKAEALNLTIQDFIDSVSSYTDATELKQVLNDLNGKCVIPKFKIKRQKINEYYYTFCSPECTQQIINYLKIRRVRSLDEPLFKISDVYYKQMLINLNNELGLGKCSDGFNKLRSHQLRKYFATTMMNGKGCKLSMTDIDFLEGRASKGSRKSYFFQDSERLRVKYAESMNNICINKQYEVDIVMDQLEVIEVGSQTYEQRKVKEQAERIAMLESRLTERNILIEDIDKIVDLIDAMGTF